MSKLNKETFRDIFNDGREIAGNLLKGPALKVVTVAGGIALVLSGCTVNAEPVNPDKPTPIETSAPSETCADFSARMQETLPQPGSAEWLEKQSELQMEVIPGETSSQTIARFGTDGVKMVYDSLLDYLPTDISTLDDCLEQIGPDDSSQFSQILGLDSVLDMSISAVVADTDELSPFRESLKYNANVFTTKAARAISAGGNADSGVNTTIETVLDDSNGTQVIGKYSYTFKFDSVDVSGVNGAYLEQVPNTNGVNGWVMTHKAPYGN